MGSRFDVAGLGGRLGTVTDGGGIVDTMVTVPGSRSAWQQTFAGLLKDDASDDLEHPAGYMFTDLPQVDGQVDYIAYLLAEMDRFDIGRALLPVAEDDLFGRRGVEAHPNRLHGVVLVDPHQGSEATAMIRRMAAEGQIAAVAVFPSGLLPPLAPDSPQLYPIHAVCCELGLPLLINVGVPGPRFPMASQHVKALDGVCYDFPDLQIVTRHGGEPWVELLVKLMLKWPNLHYSTSAFAPKYYPQAIVDYANTRGADRVIYAGYFPSGLSLERIFTELPDVGFRDEVWPAFLRTNAMRVFGLDDR